MGNRKWGKYGERREYKRQYNKAAENRASLPSGCSLSREFVEKRLGRTVQEAELSVSDDCTSLAQYLEKFDLPGQCIQDEKGLEGAAYDVLKGMHRENVIYAEIRFAPLLSENESMSCERVIEATIKGLERGKKEFWHRIWAYCVRHEASQ